MILYGFGICLKDLPSLYPNNLQTGYRNIQRSFFSVEGNQNQDIANLDDLFCVLKEQGILGTKEFPMTYHNIEDMSYLAIPAKMPWDYPITYPKTKDTAIKKFNELFELLYAKRINIQIDIVEDWGWE